MSKENTALQAILKAKIQPGSGDLQELGTTIGKLYTDQGLPLDIALSKLDGYTQKELDEMFEV